MHDATLKKMKPCLWIFAALLLGFEVFICTRSVVELAKRDLHWSGWSWTPCFFNVYLLIEVILSQNKKTCYPCSHRQRLDFIRHSK